MNKGKKLEKYAADVDELELADMSSAEITKAVKAFSKEGAKLRAERKKVRYQLYRLRTEAEGKCASGSDSVFRESFETQEGFDGWRQFASTWDVAMGDPNKVVSRSLSEQEEWDNVVASKFPQIKSDGRVVYPDLHVKAKVDAESKARGLV